MRIAVTGPESTVSMIRKAMEREIPDIQVIYRCTEFYEDTPELVRRIQAEKEADAILFSGPTNYAYTLGRVTPTVPWGFLPHSRTAALQAFLEAIAVYGSDLRSISVDRYDPALLKAVLESVGIKDTMIFRAPYDPEEPGYEKKLQEFHRSCYYQEGVTVCMTSMEHIHDPLVAEGIPCIRTYPAEEVVREQVYHLQLQHFSAQENHGKLAVIAVRYDYSFDDEEDPYIREWEKIRYQNEFHEKIFSVAQRMGSAVFESGMDHFIVTTRNMLTNVFLRAGEHRNLLQFGRRTPEYQVWVGMGVGDTMLEAKSRANMALNKAVRDRGSSSYLVEEDIQVADEEFGTYASEEHSFSYFARRMGISPDTLERLRKALREGGDVVTSEELAWRMGITARSVNRILIQLEENGFVTTVGQRSAGRGRPARVMKVTLPESILT